MTMTKTMTRRKSQSGEEARRVLHLLDTGNDPQKARKFR